MKAIPTKLVCYTRWGYPCYHGNEKSKREALKVARELIDGGYAFSYTLSKTEK